MRAGIQRLHAIDRKDTDTWQRGCTVAVAHEAPVPIARLIRAGAKASSE